MPSHYAQVATLLSLVLYYAHTAAQYKSTLMPKPSLVLMPIPVQ